MTFLMHSNESFFVSKSLELSGATLGLQNLCALRDIIEMHREVHFYMKTCYRGL